ncbi:MAG: hypothetical protein N3E51_04260 [Candidatus Micrarchaeota archaeon]|nr:hypothetical protein [Candidatus Micrarchaeota archaeon]
MRMKNRIVATAVLAGTLALFSSKATLLEKPAFQTKQAAVLARDSIIFDAPASCMSSRDFVERAVQEVNRLLPEEKRTRKVIVIEVDSASSEKYGAIYISYGEPKIVISEWLLKDSLLAQLSIFHEQTHAYFEFAVGNVQKRELGRLLSQALLHKFYFAEKNDSTTFERMKTYEADKYHPIFSIFDESNYQSCFDWRYGHPYDHGFRNQDASELWASASCVLRFYPEEFLRRLAALSKHDRQGAKIAGEIAGLVLELWGDCGFFSPQLKERIAKAACGD